MYSVFIFSPPPSALDPLCSNFHEKIKELKFVYEIEIIYELYKIH